MRKIITAVVAAVTVVALGAGVLVYQALEKTVTLTIDGVPEQVSTMSGTVEGLLQEQGIDPGEHDRVAPAAGATLNDGSRVSVRYGRPVTITVDGRTATHWTTGTSVGEVLDLLEIKSTGADLSASRSRSVGRDGFEFTVDTAKTATLIRSGKAEEWDTTATTVNALLIEAGVKLDSDDIVVPSPASELSDGTTVKVISVNSSTETEKVAIDHKTVEQDDDSLTKGTTQVAREGKDGEKTITYRVVKHDGKQISREATGEKVTSRPQDRIVKVGTKEPTRPKASSGSSDSGSDSSSGSDESSDSGSSGSSDAPAVASGSVWDRLAQCESGGNWQINTGNGFYGGLQFTAQSWRAVGGSGLPHQASREEQIMRAEKLKALQGWGAWPACTSKLGLR